MPADGWYHAAPLGDFPHKEAGLVQVIDAAAVAAMVNRFDEDKARAGDKFAGYLVDTDHFSLSTDKPSAAAGWIMALQNRNDGLWAQIRWTTSGEAAVRGGEYRFLSPVWNREDCEECGNNRVRPMRLRNAAVTNDPNLKGLAPLSNRAQVDSAPNSKGTHEMKKIANALGMKDADQADEEKIIAQIAALVGKLKGYEAKEDAVKNRGMTLDALANGDYPGHPFHGNQYAGSGEASDASKSSKTANEKSVATKGMKKGDAGHKEAHTAAKAAHESAAAKHRAAGNDAAADYHSAMAGYHGKQAGIKNSDVDYAAMENRAVTAERALAAIEIEKDLDAHADMFTNRDDARALLLANRIPTLEAWKICKPKPAKPEPKPEDKPLPNRAGAKLPEEGAGTEGDVLQQQAALIAGIRNRTQCTFEQAFNSARAEKPELFK